MERPRSRAAVARPLSVGGLGLGGLRLGRRAAFEARDLERGLVDFLVGGLVAQAWDEATLEGHALTFLKIGQQALEIDFLAGAFGRMGDAR